MRYRFRFVLTLTLDQATGVVLNGTFIFHRVLTSDRIFTVDPTLSTTEGLPWQNFTFAMAFDEPGSGRKKSSFEPYSDNFANANHDDDHVYADQPYHRLPLLSHICKDWITSNSFIHLIHKSHKQHLKGMLPFQKGHFFRVNLVHKA